MLIKKSKMKSSEIYKLDGYFRAANYLSVGQLYLKDNPLLKSKLNIEDVKLKQVGHWGTVPGQNFIITHLNRIITKNNLEMMLIVGPGHGGNAALSNCYLEGTYSKYYTNVQEDEDGLKKLFKQFSFPGGVSSHVAPEMPGSIHEGGELGYSLIHAFGTVLDNPNLITACIVGDGESETGPLSASWQIHKIMNPKNDGIVLPILHLNKFKISNPTFFSRMSKLEIKNFFDSLGWNPIFVYGNELPESHERMALAMDEAILEIKEIKRKANLIKNFKAVYPIIIFSSPKGWTGPKNINSLKIEDSFRSHQIPIVIDKNDEDSINKLEKWLRSYNPEDLFDVNGRLLDKYREFIPKEGHTLFDNKYFNPGIIKELKLPNYQKFAISETKGNCKVQDTTILAKYLKEIIKLNSNFRIFSPDEMLSNRLSPIFEETNRQFNSYIHKDDEFLAPVGQVIDSVLSEHVCEGLLEGYILTGRHGIFTSYEAFIRVVDSMLSQHSKWLKSCNNIKWRNDISSINLLLTSHCWQQDHNGYTHQEPGILNHLSTKKDYTVNMFLPPDANCLLATFNYILGVKNKINVVIASKHPSYEWLTIEEATKHFSKGIGEWEWVSTVKKKEIPDIVFACCGDIPTLETIAAVSIIKKWLPTYKIKFINVIDLSKLDSKENNHNGLTDLKYDELFTKDKPIIFAFHGYPSLIKQLTYFRSNKKMSIHGYNEEGSITTAFDMRVQNKIDRYHLILDAISFMPRKTKKMLDLEDYCKNILKKHTKYIKQYGTDIEEVENWKWE